MNEVFYFLTILAPVAVLIVLVLGLVSNEPAK